MAGRMRISNVVCYFKTPSVDTLTSLQQAVNSLLMGAPLENRSRPFGVKVCLASQIDFFSTAFDQRAWTMVVFWKDDSGRQLPLLHLRTKEEMRAALHHRLICRGPYPEPQDPPDPPDNPGIPEGLPPPLVDREQEYSIVIIPELVIDPGEVPTDVDPSLSTRILPPVEQRDPSRRPQRSRSRERVLLQCTKCCAKNCGDMPKSAYTMAKRAFGIVGVSSRTGVTNWKLQPEP